MNTQDQLNRIDQITLNFKNTFGNLAIDKINWKPNEKTWSIAQNIDHLIVINKTYWPVIRAVREGTYKTPFIGRIEFIVNFFGKAILSGVKPDRKRKIRTFPIWEPAKGKEIFNILEKFENHQQELKQLIIDCQDLVDKGTVISSPANKNIVYKLEMAFEIILTHEQRHFEQASEVFQIMK